MVLLETIMPTSWHFPRLIKKATQKFIAGAGLTPNMYTTQIEHDWNAELFDLMRRVNVI